MYISESLDRSYQLEYLPFRKADRSKSESLNRSYQWGSLSFPKAVCNKSAPLNRSYQWGSLFISEGGLQQKRTHESKLPVGGPFHFPRRFATKSHR